ncbi:MAG: DUF502 domain-containing protein [Gammaproteobacteria bacterium]|nr:DUF502 domain-containing protein [Gammaproteobacteria bacterium]
MPQKQRHLRRYLIAGLLIWLPLGVTLLVIQFLVNTMDGLLLLLPAQYHPSELLSVHIPGLGVVLAAAIVLLTGMIVANFFGRRLIALWESLLQRIPLVRSIYGSVKQLAETLFSTGGNSFRKVLLIEYPRRGIWTLAFQTGSASDEVQAKTGQRLVNVFVPTTPNPTSGFYLMLAQEEVIELDMSVDDALKTIISMGVIMPPPRKAEAAPSLEQQAGKPVP